MDNLCTKKYTDERCEQMVDTKDKTLYSFDIRCPCCNRKLMILNLSNHTKPQVSLLTKRDLGEHNTETRCYICKSFVAVDIKI